MLDKIIKKITNNWITNKIIADAREYLFERVIAGTLTASFIIGLGIGCKPFEKESLSCRDKYGVYHIHNVEISSTSNPERTQPGIGEDFSVNIEGCGEIPERISRVMQNEVVVHGNSDLGIEDIVVSSDGLTSNEINLNQEGFYEMSVFLKNTSGNKGKEFKTELTINPLEELFEDGSVRDNIDDGVNDDNEKIINKFVEGDVLKYTQHYFERIGDSVGRDDISKIIEALDSHNTIYGREYVNNGAYFETEENKIVLRFEGDGFVNATDTNNDKTPDFYATYSPLGNSTMKLVKDYAEKKMNKSEAIIHIDDLLSNAMSSTSPLNQLPILSVKRDTQISLFNFGNIRADYIILYQPDSTGIPIDIIVLDTEENPIEEDIRDKLNNYFIEHPSGSYQNMRVLVFSDGNENGNNNSSTGLEIDKMIYER